MKPSKTARANVTFAEDKKRWGRWADLRRTEFVCIDDDSLAPCKTCGRPTIKQRDSRCAQCREVEHRLTGYLRDGGQKAAEALFRELKKAGWLRSVPP